MRFGQIDQWVWFALILLTLVSLYLGRRRRKQRLASFVSESLWPMVIPSYQNRRSLIRGGALIIVLSLLVLGLMRPQWGVRDTTVQRRGKQIVLVMDVSQSMLARDVSPSRFDHARFEVLNLLSQLRGDKVALVLFAGNAFVQCPLTLDYAAFRLFLDDAQVGAIPRPGTNIAAAIRMAREMVGPRDAEHTAMIVISDGEAFEGKPIPSVEKAADWGMRVYTIGIGSETGDPVPVLDGRDRRIGYLAGNDGKAVVSRLDEETLRAIAKAGGGKYFFADGSRLVTEDLYRELSAWEDQVLEEQLDQRHKERYQWFVFPALLVLFLAVYYRED